MQEEIDFEIAYMEKLARERAAWGQYVTEMNQLNLESKCDDLIDKLESQGYLSEERIAKKVEKFRDKHSANLMYIG
jgi:hypothetical protein